MLPRVLGYDNLTLKAVYSYPELTVQKRFSVKTVCHLKRVGGLWQWKESPLVAFLWWDFFGASWGSCSLKHRVLYSETFSLLVWRWLVLLPEEGNCRKAGYRANPDCPACASPQRVLLMLLNSPILSSCSLKVPELVQASAIVESVALPPLLFPVPSLHPCLLYSLFQSVFLLGNLTRSSRQIGGLPGWCWW